MEQDEHMTDSDLAGNTDHAVMDSQTTDHAVMDSQTTGSALDTAASFGTNHTTDPTITNESSTLTHQVILDQTAASSALRFSSDVSSPAHPITNSNAVEYTPFLTSDYGLATSPLSRPVVSTPVTRRSVGTFGRLGSAIGSSQELLFSNLRSGDAGSSFASKSVSSTPRSRRGDINTTGALDRYLANTDMRVSAPVLADPLSINDMSRPPIPLASNLSSGLMTDPVETRKLIWGTTVNIESSMAMFRDFILNFTIAHKLEGTADAVITDADRMPFYDRLLRHLNTNDVHDMNLDCTNLEAYPPARRLYQQLVRYPQEIIPLMDHTLTDIYLEKFEDSDLPMGSTMRVRPFNIQRTVNLRELNPSDIDQLVTIKGLLIRSSPVLPDLKDAFFRCTSCDCSVEVNNDRGQIREPTVCPSNECKMKNSMQLIHNRCLFSDKQICRLQETPDQTPDGQTPYTVSLCVYDDLVDVGKPGDRMEVTGIFRGVPVRTNPRRRSVKALFKTYLDVVHIKRTDKKRLGVDKSIGAENDMENSFEETDDIQDQDVSDNTEEEILKLGSRTDLYEILSRSIAPSIFGMEDVKKGTLLQLFGGAHKFSKSNKSTPRIRGDINILLVGDPGVSKSQLLSYVHKLAPRGIYTSGKGSSAVGLTAYVTRDPETRQLVLESGALVLSDGGICCIDEFDKMSDHTRSVLHEVMEQQTISVAKAGIITTLNARTSILACANPINSKFDPNLSVPENVNLPPPLMSRFDLLYLILDKPSERDDRRLAQHLVSMYLHVRPDISKTDFVPLELFTKYINYAKNRIEPRITEEAGQALLNFYVSMRKSGSHGGSNVVVFTTRQLESMIRLSEAHAKMRLSVTVDRQDVEEANRLVLSALQTAAIDPRTGRLDLDLVTTGISAWGRKVHDQKRSALRLMLQESEKSVLAWPETYRLFTEQSDEKINETEFNNILRDLIDEGYIHVSGRNNTNKIIRKLGV
ncbi:hypothetical protein BDV3_002130 [Batrachochytrium dendrobatidis]|nr:MCM DNA helicase complex subunit [Batrachochytrium dendrobatidis]KAK5664755.1 MCM DNA helicase complex subunit [Batrachochytrium dendrobatidis]